MPPSLARKIRALTALAVCGACGRAPQQAAPPSPPVLPQISGTVAADGLTSPVTVVRDRWGVPHISAGSQDDLFFAQGFVQAQDRLFQLDLWRRAATGRLAEVLGPNFIERDAMTRRMQYRGDVEAEWASYGPDVKAIAEAFTRGINAWVRMAREDLPQEFLLAGWAPELWRPEDLLNRTDAFLSSGSAQDEVFRARLVAAVGARQADVLLPSRSGTRTVVPRGLDLAAVSPLVGDLLRRVGTPPFFSGFAAPLTVSGSNAWAVSRSRTESGDPLLASDPHRPLETPSLRYLVHLKAPGWDVIGATSPWLPGVVIGHNDRIAWAMTAFDLDSQDIFVENLNPANPRQVGDPGGWVDMAAEKESIAVRGRQEPFEYERLYTPRGVVVALDRENHRAYAIRWTGLEPGAAAELGALAINGARTWDQFRAALERWKLPAAEFVYADIDGNIGRQVAGLLPLRRGWHGRLPAPGWTGEYAWRGWDAADARPRVFNPPSGSVLSANGNSARSSRISELLSVSRRFGVDGFERIQHDIVAWNAVQLLPLLARVRPDRADVEEARQRLLRWDRRVTAESSDATLYVTWEAALLRLLAETRVPPALVTDYILRASAVLVPVLMNPSPAWFEGDVGRSRDALLVEALTAAASGLQASGVGLQEAQPRGAESKTQSQSGEAPRPGNVPWSSRNSFTFAHPLGITDRARQRFNVGPFALSGYADTVQSVARAGADRAVGPTFRAIIDTGDWDRSVATNAPGQSGWAGSPHFSDLAKLWAAGQYFPLAFSDEAVKANAETTLVLTPK